MARSRCAPVALAALLGALLGLAPATAADVRPVEREGPVAPGTRQPLPPAPSPAPSPEPAPEASPSPPPEEKPAAPYTEGWHAGTPPGDLFHVRLEYWLADTHRGAAFEFDHNGRRVGAVHAHSLGFACVQPVFDGGIELDAGDYGWYSFDYWQLVGNKTHVIEDGDHLYVDTLFPRGDVVRSQLEQHYAKLRDGVDVRYRFPLGEGSSLDLVFGPVLALCARYESLDVKSLVGPRSDGSHYFALTIVPGGRLGLDLHATSWLTARIGADIDWLPELPHVEPLSLTREASVRLWHDVHAFFAVRVFFLELDAGYRFFEAYSGKGVSPGGGRTREGIATMKGFDCGVSVAF